MEQLTNVSKLQVLLRRGLVHKAASKTTEKFTGKGEGQNYILKDDAECVVATVMALMAAKRNKTSITVGDTEYDASDYPTIGSGVAKALNWNGEVYWDKDIDDEKEERALISVQVPEYVADTAIVRDKTITADGEVVSPNRLKTLIGNFNALQSDKENEISVGSNMDISSLSMDEVGYMYINGSLRQVTNEAKHIDSFMATLLEPELRLGGLTFGKPGDPEADQKMIEWLW